MESYSSEESLTRSGKRGRKRKSDKFDHVITNLRIAHEAQRAIMFDPAPPLDPPRPPLIRVRSSPQLNLNILHQPSHEDTQTYDSDAEIIYNPEPRVVRDQTGRLILHAEIEDEDDDEDIETSSDELSSSSDEDSDEEWLPRSTKAMKKLKLQEEPTFKTISEKKLGSVINGELARKKPVPPGDQLQCTIWDNSVLANALKNFSCKCEWETPDFDIRPARGARGGGTFNGPVEIACKKCEKREISSKPLIIDHPGGAKLREQVALGSVLNGMDYHQVNPFLLGLGLGNVPKAKFFDHRNDFISPIISVAQEVMAENVEEAKCFATKNGAQPDDEGCIHLAASLDGTWQIKGFKSPCGVVIAIECETGKPIDFDVESKSCPKKNCKPANGPATDHNCLRNYTGPSGSMETEGIKKIFSRTTTSGYKIKFFLGDGDCKGFRKVENAYSGKPMVQKLACKNHHSKCLAPHMDKEVNSYVTLCSTNAGLGGRSVQRNTPPSMLPSGEIGPKPWGLKTALDKGSANFKHLKACVDAGISDGVISTSYDYDSQVVDMATWVMRDNVLNTARHCCDYHSGCPTDITTWCGFWKKAHGLKSQNRKYMPNSFYPIVRSAVEKIATLPLLRRNVYGKTSNSSESINSIVWSLVHKNKHHGPGLVHMATSASVIRTSDGEGGQWRLYERLGVPLPSGLVAWWHSVDRRRVLDSRRQEGALLQRRQRLQANLVEMRRCPSDYGPGIDP